LGIEPIHHRVDEHPSVPLVLEQDDAESFAKLKLLFPDAFPARADDAEIQLGEVTAQIEIDPYVRSAVRVARRICSICHELLLCQAATAVKRSLGGLIEVRCRS
jgi:hypothetical protein